LKVAVFPAGVRSEFRKKIRQMTEFICAVFLAVHFSAFSGFAAEIVIAAASDLNFALKEIVPIFEERSGNQVKVSLGSSGHFFAQISNGAPFDLFFSADVLYPKKLEEAGLAVPGSLYRYAIGRIVIWAPNGSLVDPEKSGMKALLEPSIKKIAIANPKHAPYGRAAVEAMKHFQVHDQVEPKLVLGENVSQATQFVESGAADVGIIALSLALGPTMKDKGRYWEVPQEGYRPLEQAVILIKKGKNRRVAESFLSFLQSAEGEQIMKKYGFSVAPGAPDR
jgi:molybdate transport system substrate-binding protein